MSVRIVHATPAAPVSKAHALRARDHWPTCVCSFMAVADSACVATHKSACLVLWPLGPRPCPVRRERRHRPWAARGVGPVLVFAVAGLPRARARISHRDLCTAVACGRGSHARQSVSYRSCGLWRRFRPRSRPRFVIRLWRSEIWYRISKSTNVTVMVPGFEGICKRPFPS